MLFCDLIEVLIYVYLSLDFLVVVFRNCSVKLRIEFHSFTSLPQFPVALLSVFPSYLNRKKRLCLLYVMICNAMFYEYNFFIIVHIVLREPDLNTINTYSNLMSKSDNIVIIQ